MLRLAQLIRTTARSKTVRVGMAWCLGFFVRPRAERVVFVTRANVPLGSNLRPLIDELARRGGYELAVFRDQALPPATAEALREAGVKVFDRFGWDALTYILSSGTVVLSHSSREAFLSRRRPGQRVINVWHGVALKRIESLMRTVPRDFDDFFRRRFIKRNARLYDAMIASGAVDRVVMTAAFRVPFDSVHPVGLPRYDYLDETVPLPRDLQAENETVRRLLAGRSLLLYAPTFREKHRPALSYLDCEALAAIRDFCRRTGSAFGIRTHPYEAALLRQSAITDDDLVIDLGTDRFQEPNLVLRHCSALIVDYSSIWVDFLLRDRTLVAFVPDLNEYGNDERGFIYDQDRVFPGPMVTDVGALLGVLERAHASGFAPIMPERHAFARELLMPPAGECRRVSERCAALFFPDRSRTARSGPEDAAGPGQPGRSMSGKSSGE
jgi:CDP-glycerol glycerophosphotransferase (TagB/SpsB family)